ncbi:MAG: PrsW family glutamic-type intramembrane protease [Candidatus Gracilibacteria bacterium]|nr:PrsW family glutamic-type intramembrane protease [Candidatus Gracilibacteria bacterium]
MIFDIIIFILLVLISFFPIVLWAYIFSYIDNNPLNKKRFIVGIVGGVLSVVPILYLDKFLDIFDFKILNIFYYVSNIKGLFSSFEFGISLSLFLLFLVFFSLLIGGFFNKFGKVSKVYFKNILVFLIFILFLTLGVYLFSVLFSSINLVISDPVYFGDIVFNSFKLIVFYYLLVAFIEETSKHFNFLQSSVLYIDTVKNGVLYSIFVALGFSLIENILYLHSYYSTYGLTGELAKIYFFRSIFSVIVHVLSSSVVAYYFSRALLLYREKDFSLSYLKIFFYGLFISIILHLFFDVALTLGFSIVIFLYFIGGYLYVSSIFYME